MLDKENPKYINGKINARRLSQVDYLEHINSSKLLEANEADAIYFPAGTWHINDYGKISSSISIGISVFRNADINLLIYAILKSKSLDRIYSKDINLYKNELIGNLSKELKLNILQRQSSCGFVINTNKKFNGTKSISGALIRKEKFFYIYTVKNNEHLYLIANGRVIKTLFCRKLMEFINKINYAEKLILNSSDIEYDSIIKWLLSTGLLKIL